MPGEGEEKRDIVEAERRFITRATVSLVVVTVAGAAFYCWLVFARWHAASEWGSFGSAVGPFVAFLNVGALFAALYSIALQREELRETRQEMVAQGKQFQRTADAQDRLAAAQAAAAQAQFKANEIALARARRQLSTEHGQRSSNLATLIAAEANMIAVLESARTRGGIALRQEVIGPAFESLTQQLARERELIAGLEVSLADFDRSDEEES